MSKTVEAIFENGIFRPLEKVDIKEHTKLKLILANEEEPSVQGECSLAGLIDIAKDCPDTDLSVCHDKYL